MREPVALDPVGVAGLSLTMIGVLVEQYVREGYADPTMYRALKGAGELAEHLREWVMSEAPDETELLDGVTDLLMNLELTAMECGEVVNRIIDEHGLPVDKKSWTRLDIDGTQD
jgi:hypothetical protein